MVANFPIDRLVILPLEYQSQNISFSDWISLYTLCLAPLIAHVIVGTPNVWYFDDKRPKWYDHVCHYNPTSILWRYAAITDRRIRSKSWDRLEMAATNALFWTHEGWDGSEALVNLSIPYCVRLPEHTRVAIFSTEMLRSVIVTLQGIQAMVILGRILGGPDIGDFVIWIAVDNIFFPIALIGLLRLCCVPWLSDEASYSMSPVDHAAETDSLLDCPVSPISDRFQTTSFWPSILFRVVFLLLTFGMWIICPLFIFRAGVYTVTDLAIVIFFFSFLTVTWITFLYYFAYGRTTTTVIPCISSVWYKIYTALVILSTLVLITIASIETRRAPCGRYTSGQGSQGDLLACLTENATTLLLGSSSPVFGVASTIPLIEGPYNAINGLYNDTVLDPGEFAMYNFTGTCIGQFTLGSVYIGHT
ncbi:hypothetical protein F4677DRAFT_414790 [Hypoxylon crocopeplum]|nr:hypothetical protein F4677DRAFT_414790 [Hypoxylon crocopeplum]